MDQLKDIETRADIDELMSAFYDRAFADDLLGYIFRDVAQLDLDTHLPVIGDFWETLLLGKQVYARHGRNPLQLHGQLNEKTPLESRHFRRWLQIFDETVDEMFRGERASFAKLRANAIANRMVNFVSGVPDVRAAAITVS
jgi:hemoglobin